LPLEAAGARCRLNCVFDLSDRAWFVLAVIAYGVASGHAFFLWRDGFRQDNRVQYALLLFACGLQTSAMLERGFSLSKCPVNNLFEATMFVTWTIAASYLAFGIWPRVRFLGAFASPVLFALGVFALMPGLDHPYRPGHPEFTHGWSSLHASLVLLAYGAFGLSSVAALMYLVQERDLKLHNFRAIFSRLPPIQRLEAVVGRLLLGGLLMLTAGLVVGAFYLKRTHGVYYQPDPKILWSIAVWLAYVGLIVARWQFAQRGRRLAWGTIGTFAFVMLTFWGSNLLSPIHR
jgi:ABC-type uncharacterized transport system permease subunit